jgi:hypothetical protein
MLALIDVLAVPNVCGLHPVSELGPTAHALPFASARRDAHEQFLPQNHQDHHLSSNEDRSCAGAESSRAEKSTYAEGFSQCDFKVDRAPLRDPAYRPEFPNVPLLLEEIPIVLSVEEAALLEAVKLPHCADDLGAALRDVLFSRWEERFLSASSGAPAISAPDAQ